MLETTGRGCLKLDSVMYPLQFDESETENELGLFLIFNADAFEEYAVLLPLLYPPDMLAGILEGPAAIAIAINEAAAIFFNLLAILCILNA